MKSVVIIFPGSNCDRDVISVLEQNGLNPQKVWHAETVLPACDLVVLPGGFSYGDYLRSGAMAARLPIMQAVIKHAERGGLVLGICNGFQILTEAGLLQGTLLRNAKLKFICKEVQLRVENTNTSFARNYQEKQVITIPIAHHDGNYFVDDATYQMLEQEGSIAFRYCDAEGNIVQEANPNGSVGNIAGVYNKAKNVLGLMPHPERHSEAVLGGVDGRLMFESLLG